MKVTSVDLIELDMLYLISFMEWIGYPLAMPLLISGKRVFQIYFANELVLE